MDITFTALATGDHGIFANGTLVGRITRTVEEIERPIKGTTLRHARGTKATRYSVTFFRRYFADAPMTIGSGAMPIRTLKTAKTFAISELATLTLKDNA